MEFSKRACLITLSVSCITTNLIVDGFVPSSLLPSQKASLIASSFHYHRNTDQTKLWMSSMDPIRMPALSSTMKEGKIVSWLKEEGDEVSAGEAIMVVESDKADMDVEAFEDGFIAKIITDEGETATVGDIVALIAESEAEIESVAAAGTGGETSAASTEETAAAPAEGGGGYDCETTEIFMPALSSTMVEGKIVSWLKAVGDPVTAGEAIMVVESDKADMDVEAFEDGYLAAIITDEGETAEVGAPVGIIVEEEADVAVVEAAGPLTIASSTGLASPAAAAPKAAAPKPSNAAPKLSAAAASGGRVVASPLAKKLASELGVDLASIAGSGPGGRITGADIEKAAAGGAPTKKTAVDVPAEPSWVPAEGVVAATPMARVLAKKAKLNLGNIKGTGQFGRVTADDVKIATGEKKPVRKAAAPGAPAPVELPEGLVPFDGMKKAVSNNMEATLSTPIFRVSRDIQTDKFDELYKKVKPDGITVSALLAKAVAMAVEKHPIMNSSFDPKTPGTVYNKDINIAMAVAIDGGLITPTLKNANERNIVELGQNWKELVGKAKTGSLTADEFQSGTFTISNLGMFGVSQFDAILPPGQGSILAIGGTQEKVVPDKSSILGLKIVKKMTVTLTCDHRQIYGADAALFLRTLADIMENRIESLTL
mmetsp:Transcript_27680/g.33841  ORF Transcript_27680/g.33841 Transcript_27680/m.33841 type:complete len:656 (-) Transcript_27680:148-2115(-)